MQLEEKMHRGSSPPSPACSEAGAPAPTALIPSAVRLRACHLARGMLAVAAAAGFGVEACAQPPAARHEHVEPAAATRELELSGIRVDFELLDRDGRTVRDEDFRGRYLLVGFGFTRCTDVCPAMAFNIARALETNAAAAGVFVSVDTERDGPASTDDYARGFHERLTGLGGSLAQVNQAAANFQVSYVVTKTQNAYTVQHTSYVYLIDPRGDLAQVFSFTTPPNEIAAAMR